MSSWVPSSYSSYDVNSLCFSAPFCFSVCFPARFQWPNWSRAALLRLLSRSSPPFHSILIFGASSFGRRERYFISTPSREKARNGAFRFMDPNSRSTFYHCFLNHVKGLADLNFEPWLKPFWWYFKSALPRACLTSLVFLPFGFLNRKLESTRLLFPALFFVLLYSFNPHKELRFIIYIVPILNVVSGT